MGWVVSITPRPLYTRERPLTHCKNVIYIIHNINNIVILSFVFLVRSPKTTDTEFHTLRCQYNWAFWNFNRTVILLGNKYIDLLVRPVEDAFFLYCSVRFCVGHGGKAVSLQAWGDPEGSMSLRLPEFIASRHMKAVRLSAICTGRLYSPPERFLVFISVRH